MNRLRWGKLSALWLMTVSIIIYSIINACIIYSVKDLLDYGIAKNTTAVLMSGQKTLITLLFLLIFRLITVYLKANYLKQSLLLLKTAYIEQLMNQDITQLQKDNIATYYSDLTNGFDRIEEKHFTSIINLITALSQIIIALVLLAIINIFLALATILLFTIFLFIVTSNSKPLKHSESNKSDALTDYTAFIDETINGFETIQQYQLKERWMQKFAPIATKVQEYNLIIEKKSTNIDALNSLMQMSIIFLTLLMVILASKNAGIAFGDIVVIASSFSNIYNHLTQVNPLLSQLNAISKLFQDFQQHLTSPNITRPHTIENIQQLDFKNVSLHYHDYLVLKDVNLTIQPKEKVLIIGRSGSGKTSLLKSIHQSLLPSSGAITANGYDIQQIKATDYYRIFSVVDQIGFIFSGSVKDNITLLHDIDDNKVQAILNRIGLHHLPLNMILQNNGTNISGGQRARLLMARALCLNNQVILADEIFASLESDIALNLEHDLLSLDKTIINVSHIIFKENLDLYDKIFLVDNHTVRLVQSKQEVYDQMILMNE